MENCEVMTSSPHSFAYSYRLVKKCFLKICETSKCHNFLIFQPIFIRFSLLCLKFFTLSSEIELKLLWSSSLIHFIQTVGLLRIHSIHTHTHTHTHTYTYEMVFGESDIWQRNWGHELYPTFTVCIHTMSPETLQ